MCDALRAQNLNVHLIGRATKTKIALDQDYIDERLPIAGKEMIYRQVENSFTQPNAAMNIQMLEWALDVTKGSKGDLLELYCGNGNLSLALARNFDRVLATEIAKPSVAAAQYNIAANHIDNVQIIRMAAEAMNIQMLEWALDVTKGSKGDLLELYCGNGNFSLALARNFERVLATEIAKPSVAAAQYNIAANHIDNVQIIRMASEEFTQAMNGVREFNRLQGIDLKSYQCETIFVDPPRSGLDRAAVWTVKPRKWCRRIHVFCISPAIRKRYARIWKH